MKRLPKTRRLLCALTATVAGGLAAIAAADPILESVPPIFHDDEGELVATAVQSALPRMMQRATNIDGSLRAAVNQPWDLAGNLGAVGGAGSGFWGAIDLATGGYSPTIADIALPAPGFSWVVGRAYNAQQFNASNGSHHASDGYQGRNWMQTSQPEIRFFDHPTDAEQDIVYIVLGHRLMEFKRTGPSSGVFRGINGAGGLVQSLTSPVNLFVYYDQQGTKTTFFGNNTSFGGGYTQGNWQLWKIEDPAGNVAYVGHASTASTAISSGYFGDGRIALAYDSAGRSYTYTYTSIDGDQRLTEVDVERWTGSEWVNVQIVNYTYYTTDDLDENDFGDPGCLRTATVTTPLTDGGVSSAATTYYRYWKGAYDPEAEPPVLGHPYAIQYVVEPEGYRRADIAGNPLTMSPEDLAPFAAMYFEYHDDEDMSYDDNDRRISRTWMHGHCGCSGAASGDYLLTYEENGSFSDSPSDYDTEWKCRVVIQRPDESRFIQYFDEVGQPLSTVVTTDDPDDDPGEYWVTQVIRDAEGRIEQALSPAKTSSYDHSDGTFTTGTGLVREYIYGASDPDLDGFVTRYDVETSAGTAKEMAQDYATATLTVGGETLKRVFIAWERQFHTVSPGEVYDQVTFANVSYHSSDAALMPKETTVTLPTVSAPNNGSGSANTVATFMRKDGTVAFHRAEDGVYTYTQYANGQLVKEIEDAQTNHGSDFAGGDDPNGDFAISESVTGLRRITSYTYDAQGRMDTLTRPDGRVLKYYYSKLGDGRLVTVSIPKYDSGSGTFYGPADYTVRNLADQTEARGSIALSGGTSTTALTGWINESSGDPIAAITHGVLSSLAVNIFDDTGTRVLESRWYFDIAGPGFDTTAYGYDDTGRLCRTVTAAGTITRRGFDPLGRVVETYVGSNDNSFDGGSTSGPDDMVKTESLVYDKNSNVVTLSRYIQDSSTGIRTTDYVFDERSRLIVEVRPAAPHSVHKYDNLGRRTATGVFASVSTFDETTDPTSTTTGRLGLTEVSYDELGRAWKTVRHEVNQSTGALGSSLTSRRWYDAAGREIKSAGERIVKTEYDRVGRSVRVATVAKSDDSAYTDSATVTGDHLLNELVNVYLVDSDNLLASVSIDRFHDDDISTGTTGRLDTNADSDDLLFTAGNIEGRAQITAMWYDALDRVTDTVRYGTHNGASWDRYELSLPSRSDVELVTSFAYDDSGRLRDVTDPMGRTTRTLYDDLGRTVATIANYVNGVPSGSTADDDHIVRAEYTDGFLTKQWVDVNGDDDEDTDDQITVYAYGVTKGAGATDSRASRGDLLREVTYPEGQAGGSTTVEFAYNALGQQTAKTDQMGNVFLSNYDDAGRRTHERITVLDGSFDGSVLQKVWGFDDLGRLDSVVQTDSATNWGTGTVLDEVVFAYDDWGRPLNFVQNHGGPVASTSGDYGLHCMHTRAAPTGGWETIRQTGWELKHDTTGLASVTYEYLSSGGLADDSVSRISRVKLATTVVAEYDYLGTGSAVGIQYPEVDMMANRFGASAGTYPDLDDLNRLITDRWTKDLATDRDVYLVDLTYDRDSNITWTEDGIYPGRDVKYQIDGQNRVLMADEGTRSGSNIASRTRTELWTLSQVGNWSIHKLDLDGNGGYTGTGEMNDQGMFSLANELEHRDVDNDSNDDFNLVYDAVGNLTDDDEDYQYVYDAWGRLKNIKNQSNNLVAEYRYNGLGYRIAWHDDVDGDMDVDGSDPWYYLAYDDSWRIVGTFRSSDTNAKEVFVPHPIGRGLDGVILRDKDANTAWGTAMDGAREQRYYYCQNWRSDVVKLISATGGGRQGEAVRYSAYGVPFSIPTGDLDGDGDRDITDTDYMDDMVNSIQPYSVIGDLDLDGDVDFTDSLLTAGAVHGRGVLSEVGNRRGYAGYEHDVATDSVCHVRNRAYLVELGRWTRRDPMGYVDGMSLYAYVMGRPITSIDPTGLMRMYCMPKYCHGGGGHNQSTDSEGIGDGGSGGGNEEDLSPSDGWTPGGGGSGGGGGGGGGSGGSGSGGGGSGGGGSGGTGLGPDWSYEPPLPQPWNLVDPPGGGGGGGGGGPPKNPFAPGGVWGPPVPTPPANCATRYRNCVMTAIKTYHRSLANIRNIRELAFADAQRSITHVWDSLAQPGIIQRDALLLGCEQAWAGNAGLMLVCKMEAHAIYDRTIDLIHQLRDKELFLVGLMIQAHYLENLSNINKKHALDQLVCSKRYAACRISKLFH